MQTFNILLTSAGRRVALVRHFKTTLNFLEIPHKVVATDFKKNAPAIFAADCQEQVPRVTDSTYVSVLKEFCKKYEIKLLIPLIDTELNIISSHQKDFEELGVTVLVCSCETNEICIDKTNTYNFFKKFGFPTPEIIDSEQAINIPETKYPLIVKPADGSSSIGVTKVWNTKELLFYKDYVPKAIIQEFVNGQEYTLDILVDFQGQVRCVVPRRRIETRSGEISKGITVKDPTLIAAGKKVVEALPGVLGCITVQCFVTPEGQIKFIEINPRFGGGIPLSIQAGADFPRWIIEMMLGRDCNICIDGWQDGIAMLRYDDAIFIPSEIIA